MNISGIGNCVFAPCMRKQEDARGLDEEERELVERLEARDREVRAHEQAHAAALGAYGGGIAYTFQVGPDGKLYAVGGKIEIAAGADTPEAQADRAQRIRMAVGAVSDPSIADMVALSDANRTGQDAISAREQARAGKELLDLW